MKTAHAETFNNLIDIAISMDEDPETAGSADTILKHVLSDYFFYKYTSESKTLLNVIKNMNLPDSISGKSSLLEVSAGDIQELMNGDSINDTLSGKIMLSPAYLKMAYPHHTPAFNKLPADDKGELISAIKEKNDAILHAFSKMERDIEAAKNRKILTLIALILRNIHLKTGLKLVKHEHKAEDIIRSIFSNCDSVFTASQTQLADLKDDTNIKNAIKSFFVIKKFSEISEITAMFKKELSRFTRRTQRLAK